MGLTNMLKDETTYGAVQPADPMYIAFGIDENFIQPLGVCMASILEHDTGGGIEFHVFSDAVPSEDDAARFTRAMDKHGSRCVWHVIDATALRDLPHTVDLTLATYFRFIAGDRLCGKVDRFFYLDADIICTGDLREVYATPMDDDTILAAVTNDEGCFNAGVMLVNTSVWQRKDITGCALRLLHERGHEFPYLDNDALNLLCHGHVRALPYSCNTICTPDDTYPPETLLVHYTRRKPWRAWYEGKADNLFRQCQARSEWRDTPVVAWPRTRKHCHRMATFCRQHERWGEAMKWYWRYAKWKLFGVGYSTSQ